MKISDTVHMDITEFRELGFLQEVNRLFFHPLGLALETTVEEDGKEHISGLWDYRDDPEGIIYAPSVIDPEKVQRVKEEREKHRQAREETLGVTVEETLPGIQAYDPA